MRDFAKIFKIDEIQVLYFVEYDSDHAKEEMAIVHQMIQDDDINFDLTLKNVSVDVAFKIFDALTEESAQKLIFVYENSIGAY